MIVFIYIWSFCDSMFSVFNFYSYSHSQYLTVSFMASNILNLSGKYICSKTSGNGVSYPATLRTGASRKSKHFSWILDVNSAPKPQVSGASWVTIHFPVFCTDYMTVSSSHGKIVLKSIISTETPASLAIVAAILATLIYKPYAISVTSVPSYKTSAFPSGIV